MAIQRTQRAVQGICGALAGHILKHLGKSSRDVKYEPWLSNGPLGGMEATPIPAHLSAEDGRPESPPPDKHFASRLV